MNSFDVVVNNFNPPLIYRIYKVGNPNNNRYISGASSGTGTIIFNADVGTHDYQFFVVDSDGCQSGYDFSCTKNNNTPSPCPTITLSVGNIEDIFNYTGTTSVFSGGAYERDIIISGGTAPYTVNFSATDNSEREFFRYISGGTTNNSKLRYEADWETYLSNTNGDVTFINNFQDISVYVTDANGCISNTVVFETKLRKRFRLTNTSSNYYGVIYANPSDTSLNRTADTRLRVNPGETYEFCTFNLQRDTSSSIESGTGTMTVTDLGICIS